MKGQQGIIIAFIIFTRCIILLMVQKLIINSKNLSWYISWKKEKLKQRNTWTETYNSRLKFQRVLIYALISERG